VKSAESVCSCCKSPVGARHRRESDPEWFGSSHWPTPLDHERSGQRRSVAVVATNVAPARPKLPPKPAKPVFDTLEAVTTHWAARVAAGEVTQGMATMQLNSWIKRRAAQ